MICNTIKALKIIGTIKWSIVIFIIKQHWHHIYTGNMLMYKKRLKFFNYPRPIFKHSPNLLLPHSHSSEILFLLCASIHSKPPSPNNKIDSYMKYISYKAFNSHTECAHLLHYSFMNWKHLFITIEMPLYVD